MSHNTNVDMNFFQIAANPSGVCACCGDSYQPPAWCFYDLCNPCFARFDDQKMRGRFGAFVPGYDATERTTESAKEWISWQKAASH